jgi:hypothetical protein
MNLDCTTTDGNCLQFSFPPSLILHTKNKNLTVVVEKKNLEQKKAEEKFSSGEKAIES